MLRKLAGYIVLAIWPALMVAGIWREAHACDGHSCGLWQDAALKSPQKARVRINLGLAYQKKGKLSEAIREYQNAEALAFSPNTSPHDREMALEFAPMNISDILMNNGHPDDAMRVLTNAWNGEPGFPGFGLNISSYYLQVQPPNPDKALEYLNSSIDELAEYRNFAYPKRLYLNRGIAHAMRGECDLAAADFREARLDPDLRDREFVPCPYKEN